MVIKLKVYDFNEADILKGRDIKKAKVIVDKSFKNQSEMADFIEKDCKQKCKRKLIFMMKPSGSLGSLKQVKFDGTFVSVEGGNL